MTTASLISINIHLGPDTQFRCYTYPDTSPILSMTFDGGWLDLAPRERKTITDQDLRNARALVAQAQTYLAECERLHARQIANSAAA